MQTPETCYLPPEIIEWFEAHYKRPTIKPQKIIQDFTLSRGVIYNALATGEIPAFKIGGRWQIPTQEFKSWLNSKSNMA